MNNQRLSVGISLFFALCGTCLASTPVAQGVIQFRGSIVEANCDLRMGANSTVELSGCTTPVRNGDVSARNINPTLSVSTLDDSRVDVKLLNDSRKDGHYYEQQYLLVDGAGKPVTAGNYLITLTTP